MAVIDAAERATKTDYDVAIVGYGPVGQSLAGLLGMAGHRVGVFERFGSLYALPRAAHFDHEVMRIWQRLGVVDEIAEDLYALDRYVWFGADGEQIMTMAAPNPSPSGWEADYLFLQPEIERALDRVAQSQPSVGVERGWTAESLEHADGFVRLGLGGVREVGPGSIEATGEHREVTARFVVGADGANSFVREAAGIGWIDLGFAERWLTLDVRPDDVEALEHLPTACQWCDPARPHMQTRIGRRHRRWEFMLHPDEENAEFEDPKRIWELLEPFLGPDDGELIRHAVYEFRSLLAETMRSGNVLLAGDAAHLMPPFMGQGMCSGIRDANNLAWKLGLILRGEADDELLDSYTAERLPQSEFIVRLSIEMGRVSCELDAAAAAERDATLRAVDDGPAPSMPGVAGPGAAVDADEPAGELAVQGRISSDGRVGLFDDIVGPVFAVITRDGDPRADLNASQLEALGRIRAAFVSLDPSAPGGVADLDGWLGDWLDGLGAAAVIVRPDFYVYGAVAEGEALPALVDRLLASLCSGVASRT
jgi:2-polyprenyl-6-methoxyphenol hydroxylase-like FAD-dependent oxidoreductase